MTALAPGPTCPICRVGTVTLGQRECAHCRGRLPRCGKCGAIKDTSRLDGCLCHDAPAPPPRPTDILDRLHAYNPPDRTIDEQRQIAQDMADAAAEIERLRRIIDEAIAMLSESKARAR